MDKLLNSDSSKKILIFTIGKPFGIGGVQRSMPFLCNWLSKNHTVTMCMWRDNTHCTKEHMTYPVCDAVNVEFIERSRDKLAKDIERLVATYTPDVAVIINSSEKGLIILKSLIKFNIPTLYSIRGSSEYCVKYLWSCRAALELAFWGADSVHVLMESYKNFFDLDLQKKIEVIPSPIETASAYAHPDMPNADGEYIVCYSGRFSFEKRVHLLIQAFALIHKEFPDWKCVLYGSGPDQEEIEALISELGIEEQILIKHCKNTEEMYKEYPKTHLFVLPSEQEGCPMALREAMAHKIPVIGYQECSGTNEIIKDGINGLLIDNDDRVSRLAEAMRKLMGNGVLREELGEEAVKTSQLYNPENINKLWEKLIVQTANKKSSSMDNGMQAKHEEAIAIIQNITKPHDVYKFTQNRELYAKYKKEYLLIWGHKLFDIEFYLSQYPEIKISGEDPLLHYIHTGWKQGNNPSAFFDNDKYINKYIKDINICPLVHYYSIGRFLDYKPEKIKSYFLNGKEIIPSGFKYTDDLERDFRWISE